MRGRASLGSAVCLAVPLLLWSVTGAFGAPASGSAAPAGSVALPADTIPDKPYYGIVLRRPGALLIDRGLGYATVSFPETPFNVALTRQGHYIYDLLVSARGLPPGRGTYVLWLASPDLTHLEKVGVIDRESTLRARAAFDNKFVLFITEEASADVDRPAGRVVLRGISRSARMESMFSHGG